MQCLDDYDAELWVRWSPDGRRLAFVSDFHVTIADSDGGNPRRLARLNPGDDSGEMVPAASDWSPDSQRVVFSSFVSPRAGFHVFTARVDTGEVKRVSRDSPRFELLYDLARRR